MMIYNNWHIFQTDFKNFGVIPNIIFYHLLMDQC